MPVALLVLLVSKSKGNESLSRRTSPHRRIYSIRTALDNNRDPRASAHPQPPLPKTRPGHGRRFGRRDMQSHALTLHTPPQAHTCALAATSPPASPLLPHILPVIIMAHREVHQRRHRGSRREKALPCSGLTDAEARLVDDLRVCSDSG